MLSYLGSIFNYLEEYFQLPWGVCSTIPGRMFNYPGENFQLHFGVFSITLESILNCPGEYVRLPWGVFELPWWGTTFRELKVLSKMATGFVNHATGVGGHWP